MEIRVVSGADLTDDDMVRFDRVAQEAHRSRGRQADPIVETLRPNDIHFFAASSNGVVAVGRYKGIQGIYIGDAEWAGTVWRRSPVAVTPERGSETWAKTLLGTMVEYARARSMSQFGVHAKRVFETGDARRSRLAEQYRDHGLIVEENIGSKLHIPQASSSRSLEHTNISYLAGDPFISTVRASRQPVYMLIR